MSKYTIYFDLETTGISKKLSDLRIIEICAIKVDSETLEEVDKLYYKLNNDGIAIQPDAYERHGIKEEDLIGLPTFNDVAKEVYDFFGDCDLGGYYCSLFDIPILYEGFLRAGLSWCWRDKKIYDVYENYKKYHSTRLCDVYKEYTGKELIDAHEAEADIRATLDVYREQKRRGEEFDADDLTFFKNNVDISGNFKVREDETGKKEIYIAFGKYKDQSIDNVDSSYLTWLANGDFPTDTRAVARKILRSRTESL